MPRRRAAVIVSLIYPSRRFWQNLRLLRASSENPTHLRISHLAAARKEVRVCDLCDVLGVLIDKASFPRAESSGPGLMAEVSAPFGEAGS